MNLFGIVAMAEGATAPADAAAGSMGAAAMAQPIIMLIVMVLLFYFMLIRPQKKRDKQMKAMLDAMKVGDKVVTIGGICGKVVRIKDTFVFIETGNIGTQDEKSVLKMERSAVKTVETKQSN